MIGCGMGHKKLARGRSVADEPFGEGFLLDIDPLRLNGQHDGGWSTGHSEREGRGGVKVMETKEGMIEDGGGK
jgi:hypothetical protein